MMRLETHPGLSSGEGWNELAYETGHDDWPLARLRVTPIGDDEAERIHQPNAEPVQGRVTVRLSASLIDDEGAVERINGKLLLGPESIHAWQFDADAEFDPAAWLDACAEKVIFDLIRQARGLSAAAAAGLLLN